MLIAAVHVGDSLSRPADYFIIIIIMFIIITINATGNEKDRERGSQCYMRLSLSLSSLPYSHHQPCRSSNDDLIMYICIMMTLFKYKTGNCPSTGLKGWVSPAENQSKHL